MIDISMLEQLAAAAPVAQGYRFELLTRQDVSAIVASVSAWFPDISVGSASRYQSESFYVRKVLFADALTQDNIILLLKRNDEVTGMFACEIDRETRSVYAGLGVAAPQHRGTNLAHGGMMFTEELARRLNMGFVFGFATLKHTYAQTAFERAGWQLVGIMPGYDREMIEPGIVKRVFEAMYAKVLGSDVGLMRPQRHNLTQRTQRLFDSVFSSTDLDGNHEALQQQAS